MYARYHITIITTQVGDEDGLITLEKCHSFIERSRNEWHHVFGQRVPYGNGERTKPKNRAYENKDVQKHQIETRRRGLECWIGSRAANCRERCLGVSGVLASRTTFPRPPSHGGTASSGPQSTCSSRGLHFVHSMGRKAVETSQNDNGVY